MVFSQYIAHTRDFDDRTQPLSEHLQQCVDLVRKAARKTGVPNLGELAAAAALLHDMGKFTQAFQRHLYFQDKSKVPHAGVGAQLAVRLYGENLGRLLAYCICGHHGGLPDFVLPGEARGLRERLTDQECAALLREALPAFQREMTLPQKFPLPSIQPSGHPGFSLAMLVRMVYSLLVDADFLDTEAFCKPDLAQRRNRALSLAEVHDRFFAFIDEMQRKIPPRDKERDINRWRNRVYEQCLLAAGLPKGFFTLAVPTGGGKTLSSMAFALRHAIAHGMQRVIYGIPYTSIIEQNADVFRRALVRDEEETAVLEHHSNIDLKDSDGENPDSAENLRRLASENWDAPVVVTTNVQFFESLFANKPSRCRKLHRIAGSVIVLDEAQMIPDDCLRPCLAALQCLVRDYGCTVVLCTATQPDFSRVWPDPQPVTPIIADPRPLFDALKRVTVTYAGTLSQEDVARRMSGHGQVLCIVNTRKAAQSIFDMLPEDGRFHLSTFMCARHRSVMLFLIRKRLRAGLSCRVVSTQLIEAGVDVNFPTVYRAAAGLDSIAQAAGRCNREGKPVLGEVVVFWPREGLPRGPRQYEASLGIELLQRHGDGLGEEAMCEYFATRYGDKGKAQLDAKGILALFKDTQHKGEFPFATVADAFRMIETPTIDIVIPCDARSRKLVADAEASDHPAHFLRRLQRYMVGVYPNQLEELRSRCLLPPSKLPCPVLRCYEGDFDRVYSPQTGLCVSADMPTWMI